jgi:cation transport ATPase
MEKNKKNKIRAEYSKDQEYGIIIIVVFIVIVVIVVIVGYNKTAEQGFWNRWIYKSSFFLFKFFIFYPTIVLYNKNIIKFKSMKTGQLIIVFSFVIAAFHSLIICVICVFLLSIY